MTFVPPPHPDPYEIVARLFFKYGVGHFPFPMEVRKLDQDFNVQFTVLSHPVVFICDSRLLVVCKCVR